MSLRAWTEKLYEYMKQVRRRRREPEKEVLENHYSRLESTAASKAERTYKTLAEGEESRSSEISMVFDG